MTLVRSNTSSPDVAVYLADIVRSVIGTGNKIKCIVDGNEELFVKDTMLLLQNLDIEHPVGQYVVSICKTFHTQHGCGTKTLLCMMGLLMRTAVSLRSKGVPVLFIIRHLRHSMKICCAKLEDLKVPIKSQLSYYKTRNSSDDHSIPYINTEVHVTDSSSLNNGYAKGSSLILSQEITDLDISPGIKADSSDSLKSPFDYNLSRSDEIELDRKATHISKNESGDCLSRSYIELLEISKNVLLSGDGFSSSTENCKPFNSDLNHYIEETVRHTKLEDEKKNNSLSSQSCNVVHLKMASHNLGSNSDNEDIDWFFDIDQSDDSNSYFKKFIVKNNPKLGFEKNITVQNFITEEKSRVTSEIQSHVTSESQSDSDFDDCFDDIPTTVKFEFSPSEEKDENLVKTSFLDKKKIISTNKAKFDLSLSSADSVNLQQIVSDKPDIYFELNQRSDDNLLNSSKIITAKYKELNNQYDNQEIDAGVSPNNEVKIELSGKPNLKGHLDEIWESCFDENRDRGSISSQGNITMVTEVEHDCSSLKSVSENLCIQKSKLENPVTKLDNLMKILNIKQPVSMGTSSKILNSSRHFKTIDSSVNEMKIANLEHADSILRSGIDGIYTGDKTDFKTENETNKSMAKLELNVLKSNIDSKFSETNLSSYVVKTVPGFEMSNKSQTGSGFHNPAIPKTRSVNVGDKRSECVDSSAESVQGGLKKVNSLLDKINNLKSTDSSKTKFYRQSLVRSRHFQEEKDLKERPPENLFNNSESDLMDSFCNVTETVGQQFQLNKEKYSEISVDKTLPMDAKSVDKTPPMDAKFNKIQKTDTDVLTREVTLGNCIETLNSLAQSIAHGDLVAMDTVVKILLNQWKDRMDADIDEIRLEMSQLHCFTTLGPLSVKPEIVQGLVLPVTPNIMSQIKPNKQLRTVVFNGDVSSKFHHTGYKKSADSQVTHNIDSMTPHNYSEDRWLLEIEQVLKQYSVDALMAKGIVCEDVKVICESCDIVVMEMVPFRALQAICCSADIPIAVYTTDICEDYICNVIKMSHFHDDWMPKNKEEFLAVVECDTAPLQTMVYCHPTKQGCDLMEQEFWRCANLLSSALKSGHILPGCGQTETECAEHMRQEAERRLRAMEGNSNKDDLYFISVLEEVSYAFNEYQNLVLINSSTHRSTSKSSLVDDANLISLVCTNGNRINSETEDDIEFNKLSLSCSNFESSSTNAKHSKDFVLQNKFSAESMETESSEIFDDYKSKIDSWNVAVNTVITILQTDSYVITGVTNEMRNQKYKSDIIL